MTRAPRTSRATAEGEPCARARPEDVPELFDVHTHAWPPRLYAAIVRWFERHAWPVAEQLDGEAAAAHLAAQGVRRWVAMAYCHKPGMARPLNAFLGAYARRHPEAVVLAAVHPFDPDARDILGEAFDEHGLRGLKLHCHVMGLPPDEPALAPVLAFVAARGLPVVIHAGRAPELPGYPAGCGAVSGVARIARMLERHPDLRCVVPHFAHDEHDALPALFERHPLLMTDTAMVLAGHFDVAPPRELILRYAARIMYGTDFPVLPYPYATEWQHIRALGLPPEIERQILFDNAARFFDEGAPRPGG
ncbi:MAG: amidohydrolase [Myxococcales bacterium]|nr:amidohydrolase [Myxococcales bacterium]